MADRIVPKEIQAIGNELAIAWNDGAESYIGMEALRRACPCAVCGGEPDVLGQVVRPAVTYTARSFTLSSFQIVGGYALQPAWADGHGSGSVHFSIFAPSGRAAGMSRAAKLALLSLLFTVCGGGVFWQYRAEHLHQIPAPGELYEVVLKQVAAFRSDDYAVAYRQASSTFQEKFDIEAFADLVRTEYPGILHAARVEFGAVRIEGARAVIPAYFFMRDGEVIPCVYDLIREEEIWKIDNVRVLRRLPVGRRWAERGYRFTSPL